MKFQLVKVAARLLLFALIPPLSGCNPLVGQANTDASFNPGISCPTLFSDSTQSQFSLGISTGPIWDTRTNSTLRLSHASDGSNASDLELASTWTPSWSSLFGYWKLNETAAPLLDGSPNTAYSGATAGGVTLGSPGQLGNSALFDGSSGYIALGNDLFNTHSQGTISAWVKLNSQLAAGGFSTIFSVASSTSFTNLFTVDILGSTASTMNVRVGTRTGNNYYYGATTSLLPNQWYHVVATGDGVTWKTYVNGVPQTMSGWSGANIGQWISTQVAGVMQYDIGVLARLGGSIGYFQGSIDDVAVWNTVLPQAAIAEIYQHEAAKYAGTLSSRIIDGGTVTSWNSLSWLTTLPFFKPLPDGGSTLSEGAGYSSQSGGLMSGIAGLWHLDETAATASGANNVKDRSGANFNGTLSGAVTFGSTGKFGTAALFNGSTGYIALGNALYDTQSQGTLSAWVKLNSQNALNGVGTIFSSASSTSATNIFDLEAFGLTATDMRLRIADHINNSYAYGNTSLTPNLWYHVSVTTNGSSWSLYVNGVLQTLSFSSGSNIGTWFSNEISGVMQYATGATLKSSGTNGYFPGSIDELSVWNRPLTAAEIQELYRRGANRVLFQVRNCLDSTCSTGPAWQGSDGTDQTYFTELNNNFNSTDAADLSLSDMFLTPTPLIYFTNFTNLNLPANRYFQYRAIMESDDNGASCNYGAGATWCSPELQTVSLNSSCHKQ